MRLPAIAHNGNFRLYWLGVALSQIGSRATIAATLWQVFQLTDSTLQVGLIGFFDAFSLLVLSPLGGAVADRLDRRRLLQMTQATSGVLGVILAVLSLTGQVQPWHIYLCVLLLSGAATFDQPARLSLVPAMVPRDHLVQAYALVNPTREVSWLLGPAVAGLLLTTAAGPSAVYFFDAFTYAALAVVLVFLHVPVVAPRTGGPGIWASIGEGVTFMRQRPIIWQLVSLDVAAMMFAAYRVLMPAIARDILHVGPAGYGFLSGAPSIGALAGSVLVFKLVRAGPTGQLVLGATIGYGLAAVVLARATQLPIALAAAVAMGVLDALSTTVRHAAVQLETPDEIRGRVTSLYTMASRGSPALGDSLIGGVAAVVGVPLALTLGGLATVAYALYFAVHGGAVRDYAIGEAAAQPAS